ncbi:MAG: ribosome small subunit-dependent GTPase A [Steroidobacteraceae bacterium]
MSQTFEARVIAAYGRHALVRDADGTVREARPQGRRLDIVCGDQVRCQHDAQHDSTRIVEVLPRSGTLYRSNLRGAAEAVVANVTRLVAVVAPKPAPDLFIIDRYLAAAASAGIGALVVLNKADLPDADQLATELEPLRGAGYTVLRCRRDEPASLSQLAAALQDQIGVLVGQSGVGKSSLVTRLLPGVQIATQELDRDLEGRHTTTASRMYDLPDGGALIDSPGVRDFAPAISTLEPGSMGFIEVDSLATGCRFQDCRHMREPGCAVIAAAETGRLDARRYESYRRLRRLYEDLGRAAAPR